MKLPKAYGEGFVKRRLHVWACSPHEVLLISGSYYFLSTDYFQK